MSQESEERRSGRDRRRDDERIENMIHDFREFARRANKILAGVVGVLCIFAVLFYFGFNALSDRASDSHKLAMKSAQLSKKAANLAAEIQASRVDNIRNNCLSQNARHDGGIIALDLQLLNTLRIHIDTTLAKLLPPAKQISKYENLISAAARVAGKEGRTLIATHDFAKAIIDALVQQRNCAKVVKEQA